MVVFNPKLDTSTPCKNCGHRFSLHIRAIDNENYPKVKYVKVPCQEMLDERGNCDCIELEI